MKSSYAMQQLRKEVELIDTLQELQKKQNTETYSLHDRDLRSDHLDRPEGKAARGAAMKHEDDVCQADLQEEEAQM